MNNFLIKLSLMLTPLILFSANSTLNAGKYDNPFDKLWKAVEQYENDALPRSALKKVEEIYKLALKEKNEKQIIRSTIYRLKYINTLEEDGYIVSIKKLESEISGLQPVPKAFMHLLLGNMYSLYYNINSYTINERSVSHNYDLSDIKTWDKDKFKDRIIKNLMNSLDDVLKTVSIKNYPELIEDADKGSVIFPHLYDFVAYNAISTLNQDHSYRFTPFSQINDKITESGFMTNAHDFVDIPVDADTLSYNYTILKIYQKWLEHRIADELNENNYAYAYADIARLNFLRTNTTEPGKDEMWIGVLSELQEVYRNHPTISMINYELAKYYNSKGKTYNYQNPLTFEYEDYNKKASELLIAATSEYPDAIYYPECMNLKNRIEKKTLRFETEKIAIPEKRIPVRIQYQNIDKVYLTVINIDYENWLNFSRISGSNQLIENIVKNGNTIIENKEIDLPSDYKFNEHSAEYLIDRQDKGFYIIILHHNPTLDIDENLLSVNPLFVSKLSITGNNSYAEYNGHYVLNRGTGNPISGADIKIFGREYDHKERKHVDRELFTGKTDKNGFIRYEIEEEQKYYNIRIDVNYKDDFITETLGSLYNIQHDKKVEPKVELFTDRAIYRPGQQIHFKGICYENDGENSKLMQNYITNVFLHDVNNQEISSMQVKTNEFGSFSGTFSLPLNVLTGRFRISCTGDSHSIRVEEYKRPTFEVIMLPSEKEYRLNDTVFVEGKAVTYAGTPLSDAKVSYTVVRNQRWWYRRWMHWIPPSKSEEVAFGEIKLDETGKFNIAFKAIPAKTEFNDDAYYTYTINVNVTDINGETQSGSSMVSVSNKSIIISSDISEIVNKKTLNSINISTTNISGSLIKADVKVEIHKLKSPDLLLASKKWNDTDKKLYTKDEWYKLYGGYEYSGELDYNNWKTEKTVLSKMIDTGKSDKLDISDLKNEDTGVYRLILKSTDNRGNEIVETEHFTLFSENSEKMPYQTASFFHAGSDNAQPGETVSFYVGSSYSNVHLFYTLNVKGKTLKTEIIKLSNEVKTIEIPVEEFHRGGITASFMFVKDGKLYNYNQRINVEWKNKELDLKLLTFRDKTLPGSKEEWRIKITDNEGNPQNAELLSAMYDASLDVFAENRWNFSYLPYYFSTFSWLENSFSLTAANIYSRNFHPDNLKSKTVIPAMNTYGLLRPGGRYRSRGLGMVETSIEKSAMPAQMFADNGTEILPKGEDPPGIIDDETPEKQEAPPIQIRKIFEETAFFYPHLVTDENGEIFISFTVPESLTRWNFMGIAHTKDIKIGQIRKQMITQKELMLTPNLPRFFREKDKIEISARISNISDKIITGTAKIEFFNPENLKSLNNKFLNDNENIVDFEVDADKNIAVSWKLSVPQNLSMVGVRIVAIGDKHSDGEERILPVLTNRMLVTESMPLPVRKAGTTSFKMNRLINSEKSKTLTHHNLALEFTSNPAWYAVQALPYLMEYPYDCSEQIFSRLYANMLASHIANSNPKIKRVFELWRDTPDSDALLSNLEKNQELKTLLLEETPWLLQAKDETERKRRIGLLFDLNRMSNEKDIAIKQLEELQQHNGGWSWFKGMRESWYITQHIVSGFGKLNNLGVADITNRQISTMIRKAISFIDGEFAESYNNLKNHCENDCMDKDNLGYMHIHYLYTRSFFINNYPIDHKTSEAFRYYKQQAEQYWTNKSFYMQGMIAIALNRFEDSDIPSKITASLKEHALHNDELGMYWKLDRGFFWYQAPIETQALLIEVFEEVAKDTESVDEMKVWLLKQKQTQDWKTTKATVEAIYALLLRGTELLSDDEIAVIKLGDIVVDAQNDPEIKTEAGTGYFKTGWSGAEIKPEMGNVTVTKSTDNVAWGALYWQYLEQLDKITHFEKTPLKIDKKLFVQRRQGDKAVIIPIEKDNALKLGDKVTVRIEIRVDRDMEYVHLKDMRASCFEPVDVISGFRYSHGIGYYRSIRDASMNFFINYLRKGTYVFEYDLIVSQKGNFSNGITTIQSMYAPEFTSHSEGIRVEVR